MSTALMNGAGGCRIECRRAAKAGLSPLDASAFFALVVVAAAISALVLAFTFTFTLYLLLALLLATRFIALALFALLLFAALLLCSVLVLIALACLTLARFAFALIGGAFAFTFTFAGFTYTLTFALLLPTASVIVIAKIRWLRVHRGSLRIATWAINAARGVHRGWAWAWAVIAVVLCGDAAGGEQSGGTHRQQAGSRSFERVAHGVASYKKQQCTHFTA